MGIKIIQIGIMQLWMEGFQVIAEIMDTIFYMLEKIAIVFLAVILFLLIIFGILHIFKSTALYQMAKDKNIKYPWLSVVPLINMCILTKLAWNHYSLGLVALLLAIGIFLQNIIFPWIVILCLIFYIIVNLISSYRLYKARTKHYILLTVISIITFGGAIPFILFAIRKDRMNVSSGTNFTSNKKIYVLIAIEILILIILVLGILTLIFSFS